MEEALAKIRPHTSSSLAHQKAPANLLTALEATFKEQNTEPTPTAYFASLLTTLEGTIQKQDVSLEEGAMLPAELYLLALIAPFIATPVIRSGLNNVLSLTAPLFPALNQHAPALKSQLSLYQVIFKSIDRHQLDVPGVRQAFASILQLSIDPRPKVRKKAADAIQDVLAHPIPPLLLHPYSDKVASWVNNVLVEASEMPFGKGKGSKGSVSGSETAIHVLALLRPVCTYLPPEVFTRVFLSKNHHLRAFSPFQRSPMFFLHFPDLGIPTCPNHATPFWQTSSQLQSMTNLQTSTIKCQKFSVSSYHHLPPNLIHNYPQAGFRSLVVLWSPITRYTAKEHHQKSERSGRRSGTIWIRLILKRDKQRPTLCLKPHAVSLLP